MKKEKVFSAKVIGFVGQKGGTGKTNSLVLLGQYMAFDLKKKVLAVDLDFNDTLYFKSVISKHGAPDKDDLFEVLNVTIGDFLNQFEYLVSQYDYILLDTPGELKQENYLQMALAMDYAFSPIDPSSSSEIYNNAIKYVEFLNDTVNPVRIQYGGDALPFYLFNTRVRPRAELYVNSDLNVMQTYIKDAYVAMGDGLSTRVPINDPKGDYKPWCLECMMIIDKV